jgi:hypothetical protein
LWFIFNALLGLLMLKRAGDQVFNGAGPAPLIKFDNPDFNFKSLRGNAVWRWEYSPGSTLFFVWTQSRSDYENLGNFHFNRSIDRIVYTRPNNIFWLKRRIGGVIKGARTFLSAMRSGAILFW